FLWFEKADYVGHGHITPLTQWQIHDAFTEAGLRFLWRGSFGAGASQLAGSPRLRLLARLVALLSALPRELGGEIYVAVLEKPSRSQAAATAPPAAAGR
ncbi:MAG: hypothetical protein KGJ55_11785, partial [Gammaproteobacteria bacterium]|nr:hypothetical protein [Gammaproteobacteria bacterium]